MLKETIAHVPASEAVAAPTAQQRDISRGHVWCRQGADMPLPANGDSRHGEAVFPRHI